MDVFEVKTGQIVKASSAKMSDSCSFYLVKISACSRLLIIHFGNCITDVFGIVMPRLDTLAKCILNKIMKKT